MPRYGGNPAKGLAPRICEVCGASFQPYRDISACCSSACLKRHPRVRERKNAARRRPEVRARRQAVRKPQDPETARARNLRRYGLTITDFDAMIHEQGGVCAICKRAPSGRGIAAVLHVDHDHT
ncbi:endonuclease domain-containing protein, partial [Burkholderia pseudomallei]|uniref:endonuclease domain-containing protein n=1 Tax=Burkholderiaceae TaxID=119060 RepID=UPI002AACCD86